MLTLALLTLAPAQAQHRYFHFKEPRPLTLDTTRIAVRLKPNITPQRFTRTLEPRGLRGARLSAGPVAGWSLLSLPAQQRIQPVQAVMTVVNTAQTEYVSPVFLDMNREPILIAPDILVRFAPTVTPVQAATLLAGLGEIRDPKWGGLPGAYRIRSTARNGFETLDAANRLAQRPEVLWAEPDRLITGKLSLIPNDPLFNNDWGLHNTGQTGGTSDMDMDAPEAWDYTTGNSTIIVVVMDSGVQQNHPDINQRAGADFTSEGGEGGPRNAFDNHGTVVAGCISAKINNALGVVGIAPGCLTASARIAITTDAQGSFMTSFSWLVNALDWAQSIGARVTNFSAALGATSSALEDKYAQTREAGIIHFVAAGNGGVSTLSYPASLPSVNAVAALDHNGNRASFSQYGTDLAFSAPGQNIATTDRTGGDGYVSGDYAAANGTSVASPYAAGVAALILSLAPQMTPGEVRLTMQVACVDRGPAGYDVEYGWGFVNAFQALRRFNLYVDKNNDTGVEDGSPIAPYNTFAEALLAAPSNVMVNIWVRGNNYPENFVTGKTIRIRNWQDLGVVHIGAP